jgi:tRNA(fMet)-specific endonuclease VapC
MAGRILLDTSFIVDLFASRPGIRKVIAAADEVFVPAIALGELFYGALRSARREENLRHLEAFASSAAILDCDSGTAMNYGEIKDRLRARGRPLPDNDIWIAAIARQHALTVATLDAHFQEIEGIELISG